MKIFGPVPSRRLGRSLGVNIIPYKNCSYDCIYCQVGRTNCQTIKRKEFYRPEEIFKEVKEKLYELNKIDEKIDYITFVSHGEPLLDINLGKEIELLKEFNIKFALITNSSLLNNKGLSKILTKVDWISLKIDTVKEDVWKKINRPCNELNLEEILESIRAFSKTYNNILNTETMIVKNLNDKEEDLKELANFLYTINPYRSYLSIPIRPPAEKWIEKPHEEIMIKAYHILREKIKSVEYLTGYEGNNFISSGSAKEDLLAITSVHPMKEKAVEQFLSTTDSDWHIIEELLKDNLLLKKEYKGENFYIRSHKK
ncbi:MAG TPA: radical SAM protein [Candidatus Eremiobacteraeota bacterium]|mgnify:CR=1 FL=1|nr:MAG: molybdenum cofactor biosynthesis protein A [bacterium ADurb.Bin363]HPZ07081.1 radical SAM protein [Candidatus Eremiobacteraeota bacterium]